MMVRICLCVLFSSFQLAFVAANCSRPKLQHGVIVEPKGKRMVKDLAVLMFSCSPGYEYVGGDATVLCDKRTWKKKDGDGWSSPTSKFICKEKQCPVVKIENGTVEVRRRVVTYNCDRGFVMVGSNTSSCKLDENFELFLAEDPPICVRMKYVPCKPPLSNWKREVIGNCIEEKECIPGDTLTFNCPHGYRISPSVSSSMCLASGEWTPTPPVCEKIKKCENPGEFLNANVTGDCCEAGSKLRVECHDGFELNDLENGNTLVCLSNETWSISKPKCKQIGQITCPDIPKNSNLFIPTESPHNHSLFLPGDFIITECNEEYDTDDVTFLECEENGHWDVPFPVCILKGPCNNTLPKIANGRVIGVDNGTPKEYPPGYEINIDCDEGYIIKSGIYSNICSGNNEWKFRFSDCTIINCGDPGIPEKGIRRGNDFTFQSNVTYKCLGQRFYTLKGSEVRTCQGNGRWSGTTAVCEDGGGNCPDPGTPTNSRRQGSSFNYGDTVKYSCVSKSYVLVGNETRVCIEDEFGNGYWSDEEIRCVGPNEYSSTAEGVQMFGRAMTDIERSKYEYSDVSRSFQAPNLKHQGGVDLWFIFDTSGSITPGNFQKEKDFAVFVTRKVKGKDSTTDVRIGAITFSSKTHVLVHPDEIDPAEALERMNLIKHDGKGTNLKSALQELSGRVSINLEKPEHLRRKQIAFLMSDGVFNEGGSPIESAMKVRLVDKVDLYAIAIGADNAGYNTLIEITGGKENVVRLLKEQNILDLVQDVLNSTIDFSVCGLDRMHSNDLSRIVGGKKVDRLWPWMVGLLFNGEVQCGASIIHERWILTAAHCFDGGKADLNKWRAVFGITDLTKIHSGFEYSLELKIIHESYKTVNLDYDIALLKTSREIKYDRYVSPICLPPPIQDITDGMELYKSKSTATIAGYGYDQKGTVKDIIEKGKGIDVMKELEMPIQPENTCSAKVFFENRNGNPSEQTPTNTMFCAGKADGKEDSCVGDSGGPFIQRTVSTSQNDTQYRWFVIGVQSWGPGCAQEGYYSYFTNVAKLREWINTKTGVKFESAAPEGEKP